MLSYSERIPFCSSSVAIQLLQLMAHKKTNLALSADVTRKKALLELADKLGPYICVLKTHIDIIEDFDSDLITQLQRLSNQHNFLLFEDRKFADIGNTVKQQYAQGIYRIADWAAMVTVHALPGPGVLEGLQMIGLARGHAALLLIEMSAEGNLAKGEYSLSALHMGKQYRNFVMGFITQHAVLEEPGFINFTPGVQLNVGTDTLGQHYITPRQAIIDAKSDVIIVGRGIYSAADPIEEAIEYQRAGWAAYEERIAC